MPVGLRTLREVRASLGYAAIIGITATLRATAPSLGNRLLRDSSSDLANLRRNPAAALLSALWTTRPEPWRSLVAILVVLVPLELAIGTRRWLLVVPVGHVLTTLLVAGGLVAAKHVDLVDRSAGSALDVGVSYAVAVGGAAMLWSLRGRARWAYALALVAVFTFLAWGHPGIADAGHALAIAVGLLLGRWATTLSPHERH